MPKRKRPRILKDATWYKDAIVYELHIRSFMDSDGDGIGDFKGLTSRLDYLQDLGITAIWLLPFYPSPLRDDGYDIADYWRVNPQYGTLNDFKAFLKEARKRDLRVITELVVNHTSDQHEWFQKSRKAKPGSAWRDFYVWSDSPERYKDARIIFKDFESSNWAWDPVAKAYYWHRFYSHQPDLNYDNPKVQQAIFKVMDYWFDMGVDGMRLDAVPYLYEREGTNCENLPETFTFLERLRAHVDRRYDDKMLLAEANQWPEDAVAYLGEANRCHMAFHFPVMPRLFMASWMEDRFPIIDIFEQTPKIPDTCQWALFLRNHDELTLEMVSDEERDYMYRVFAKDPTTRINLGIRRRLAPLLGNNRRKIELMNILLFSLPGTPVIYYGDEIGMGDNHYLGDRNGVRTPMQWDAGRNAGFSEANPQKLFLPLIIDPEYRHEAVNIDNQQRNQSSLYWWMKRQLEVRKKFKAFGRGSLDFVPSDNARVLSFLRRHKDEVILVVVNLSRYAQSVHLDLSAYDGFVPEEVVGGSTFPQINKSLYPLTLGPHDHYWFSLQRTEQDQHPRQHKDIPLIKVSGSWDESFSGKRAEQFGKDVLAPYLSSSQWFGATRHSLRSVRIAERIMARVNGAYCHLLFLEVLYADGSGDTYFLPVAFGTRNKLERMRDHPDALIARVKTDLGDGVIYDALYNSEFRAMLLGMIVRRYTIRGDAGSITASPAKGLVRKEGNGLLSLPSSVLDSTGNNTSLVFGKEFLLKVYRRIEPGTHPDVEMGQVLSERLSFPNIPAFAGGIEYVKKGSDASVMAYLQRYIPNQGDALTLMRDQAAVFFENVMLRRKELGIPGAEGRSLLEQSREELPTVIQELIGGTCLEAVWMIANRAADMHTALASESQDPAFAPEPFTLHYQRSLYHSIRTQIRRVTTLLEKRLPNLPKPLHASAAHVIESEGDVLDRCAKLYAHKLNAQKIRIHGEFRLEHILFTGNDYFIIDFEGNPKRSLGERRLKRSPLRDVAGMIRSLHDPIHERLLTTKGYSQRERSFLEPWAELWHRSVASVFLRTYLVGVGDAQFLPQRQEERELFLTIFLIEKAYDELARLLENRHTPIELPLRHLARLLGAK